ncbi:heme ABC transporter ATP-binding protein [Paragemmobacter ruber]|uniref:Heme ABC transporter ATP-binding protein n=1 Tax=Paragemmobacter ruber TaxID=1985673 RepID=A0ABW9Y3B4_9RHOB|nr:heme ABC transporter ATP-binding protein [Rhodobacter ruber]NBE06442.1 heme ABC transporter ATP-binding protein [Rhodobacter ruber]
MLNATDLTLVRDGRTILQGITLSARPGEVTAIIGPNGSGKTTLMAALTGDLAPVTGRVTLNGDDIAHLSPRHLAARRAVLAQETQVAFPFTVAEILQLGVEAGTGPADPALIPRLLAEVDLPDTANRPIHALSGGERQRIHLARTLAQARRPHNDHGPMWLFLDEPVSSLDIAHQLMVMRRARRFAAEGGGVVAVMHDLNLTAMTADHVVLLAEGGLLAAGPPEQVMTDRLLSRAYRCDIRTNRTPASGPYLLPQMAGAAE